MSQAAEKSLALSRSDQWTRQRIPAWLLSIVLHTALFVGLALVLQVVSEGGQENAGRPVGVALVKQSELRREYVLADTQQATQVESATNSAASVASALPKPTDLAIDLSGILPSADTALFSAGDIGTSDSADLNSTSQALPGNIGKTTTSVFGVSGTGSTFVYVFDRSASMKGLPLAAAKQQLNNSLATLEEIHKFQVIFYNEKPKYFEAAGRSASLVFSDDKGKRAGMSFVNSITAVGATRHMPAITLAINMRPDVIFFLTDADEPQLTDFELKKVRQLNRGTIINAIQFGAGPQNSRDNFLRQLARQNGGQHAYVDVTLLRGR